MSLKISLGWLVVLVSALAFSLLPVYANNDFSIYVLSPSNLISSNTIEFEIETFEETTCNLQIIDTPNNHDFDNPAELHSISFQGMNDGKYDYLIECINSENSSLQSNFSSSFTVDTTPPTIIDYEPEVVKDYSVTFTLTTDEESTCRYSEEPGKDFFEMGNIFGITGHTSHMTGFDFDKDGVYDIFIRCEDVAGNTNKEDYRARMLVDVPPTARIALSKSSPITSGTVEVDVIISEPLISTPTLRYTLQDEQGRTESFNVPLSGSGQNWKGFMIISSAGGKRVGSFEFEGRDYGGNIGRRITQGSTFIIDPVRPSRIEDFKATPLENARIRLEWEYDDHDEIEKYEIYRSTTPGVSRLHYYDYTTDKGYIDRDLNENTVYYYRIIPLDKAGNRGELSREADARTTRRDEESSDSTSSTEESQQTTESSSQGLSSNLMPILESSIQKYDGLKKLTDDLTLYFRGRTGSQERIVEEFRILNMVNSAKSEVYRRIGELEDLKKQDLDEATLRNRIREIEIRLESVKGDIPTRIREIKSIEFEQENTMQNIMNSVDALLNLLRIINLDSDIRTEYMDESFAINNDFRITGTAEILTIEFHDGNSEEFLLVEKNIEQVGERVLDETGLMVVEDFSEEITTSVRDVEFLISNPDVLRQSATVKWDLDKIDGVIKYYVSGDFSNFNERMITTTILDNYRLYFDELGREATEDEGRLTGRAIFSLPSLGLLRDFAGIIVGIFVIAGLGFYYFKMDSKPEMPKRFKKKSSNSGKKNKFHQIYEEMNASGEVLDMDETPEENYSESNFYNTKKSKKIHQDLEYEKDNLDINPKKTLPKYKQKIKKANEMIDNLNFDGASEEYINLLEMLNKEKDSVLKEQILEEMWHRLYRKIELYQNTIYLKDAMKNKDHDSMQRHMKSIIDDHNDLSEIDDENTKLMQLARDVHKKYMKFLNHN